MLALVANLIEHQRREAFERNVVLEMPYSPWDGQILCQNLHGFMLCYQAADR